LPTLPAAPPPARPLSTVPSGCPPFVHGALRLPALCPRRPLAVVCFLALHFPGAQFIM